MLAVSFKFSAKKTIAVCAVLAVTIWGAGYAKDLFNQKAQEVASVVKDNKLKLPKVKNNDDRLEIISALGWQVEDEPVEVEEVILPKEFDDVYMGYNQIQLNQGMDLEKYKGKRVKRYSYKVCNYPDAKEEIRLNILVYKDKIIAGDVCALKLDGFMHGLIMPLN